MLAIPFRCCELFLLRFTIFIELMVSCMALSLNLEAAVENARVSCDVGIWPHAHIAVHSGAFIACFSLGSGPE